MYTFNLAIGGKAGLVSSWYDRYRERAQSMIDRVDKASPGRHPRAQVTRAENARSEATRHARRNRPQICIGNGRPPAGGDARSIFIDRGIASMCARTFSPAGKKWRIQSHNGRVQCARATERIRARERGSYYNDFPATRARKARHTPSIVRYLSFQVGSLLCVGRETRNHPLQRDIWRNRWSNVVCV